LENEGEKNWEGRNVDGKNWKEQNDTYRIIGNNGMTVLRIRKDRRRVGRKRGTE
jgi:hypothetical protein